MCFCSPGTKPAEFYAFRGTRLIKSTICHVTPARSLKAAAGGATTSQRSEDWWRRALSWYRNLSLGQEQSAKTMTSLLIIPSVLGFRSIIILVVAESFLYFFFFYYWIRYQ